jgi:hypothetical protein
VQERITLASTDDGLWRVETIETTDAEGHLLKHNDTQDAEGHHLAHGRVSIEPAAPSEDGSPRWRVIAGGEDVAGHAIKHV